MTRRRGRTHSTGRDDVVARLRAADPAASLPALDLARVDSLREDAMASPRPVADDRSHAASPRRRPVLVLAAAAAVVVAAGAVWQLGGQDPAPVASPGTDPTTSPAPAPLELRVPASAAARCMVPSAEVLATQQVAFAGTVVDDAGGEGGPVTLEVTRWYAGPADERSDTVTVQEPSALTQDLLLGVDLRVGEAFLLSATDGRVSLCGLSGPQSPPLEQLYAEAFDS